LSASRVARRVALGSWSSRRIGCSLGDISRHETISTVYSAPIRQ
jgi:hypothetical protein